MRRFFVIRVFRFGDGTLGVVLSAWKPLLVFFVVAMVVMAATVLIAALCTKTNPLVILKKGLPLSSD